jgi:hypothetical protein
MPLSDRDQKVLDDIERGLYDSEPPLAASLLDQRPISLTRRALAMAISLIAIGVVLVLMGLVVKLTVVSILGFILIVAATVRATKSLPRAGWLSGGHLNVGNGD